MTARIRWWLADRLRPNVWPSTAAQHGALLEEIGLLTGVIHNYAQHDSWRCEHPPHFYLAASCPYCERRVGQPHEEGCRYVVPRSEGGRGSDPIVTREDLGLGNDCACGLLSALERAGIDPEPWRPKAAHGA